MPFLQKNGTWRATKMIDGKRRQKVFQTKAEAKKWEAGQSAGAWAQSDAPTVTAYSLAQDYLDFAKGRFSRKTYGEKSLSFRNLFRFIDPDCPADSIPPKLVLDALQFRAKASGNAANKDRKNLSAAWSWGRKYLGLKAPNPFREVERFAHDERARHVPAEDEFWAAMAAAGPEDRAFLVTALHTAARRGELFRLRWSDVDLAAGTIRLGTRKTRTGGLEYAVMPMTSELHRELSAHRARGVRSMLVFSQPDGRPFTSRQHYMERLCRRAGVRPFGFHGIRHLSASVLADAGIPIPAIQAILRHKSPNTTARYLRALGIIKNVMEDVFCPKNEAPGITSSEGFKK